MLYESKFEPWESKTYVTYAFGSEFYWNDKAISFEYYSSPAKSDDYNLYKQNAMSGQFEIKLIGKLRSFVGITANRSHLVALDQQSLNNKDVSYYWMLHLGLMFN